MIAAGGYTPELQAKPTRAWIRNESNNGLSNVRGTVAMARHPDYPHSATAQVFINVADNPSFDFHAPQEGELTDDAYGYCVLGEIIEGLDVAAQISDTQVRSDEVFPSLPVEPVVIESIHRDSAANDVN
jgi:cyclophilin family peptidyl-prolyl cis-trans isomerase